MAVPNKKIDSKLINSARAEFLEKGYLNASLNDICKNAGITTGALYKRYSGKEDLFDAVVKDAVADINAVFDEKAKFPVEKLSDKELIDAWKMDGDYMMWWFSFLFERHDAIVLLLAKSDGTKYSGYHHDLVEKATGYSYAYYLEAYRRGFCEADISRKEMHLLLSAFWTTVYEPFIHGYTFEEIKNLSPLICRLFDWYSTLKMKKPKSF
jgi:AcrR family transcriptional regulator